MDASLYIRKYSGLKSLLVTRRQSFHGKATLTPNLCSLAEHSFTGKAMRVNPKDKSGTGAPKAVRFSKHRRFGNYSATILAPNSSSINVSLNFVSAVKCGWHATWATACLPYKFFPGMRPIVHNGDETATSSLMLTQMVSIFNYLWLKEAYY